VLRTIAVTAGEPAGIGPDICSTLIEHPPPGCRIVLIGDASLFGRSRLKRAPKLRLPLFDATAEPQPGLQLLHVPLAAPCIPGKLDPANARYVLATLDAALGGCAAGAFHAIVTAPVQKSIINEAGIPFTGHTEYLGQRTDVSLPVMMLVGAGMAPAAEGRQRGDHAGTSRGRAAHRACRPAQQVRARRATAAGARAQPARR